MFNQMIIAIKHLMRQVGIYVGDHTVADIDDSFTGAWWSYTSRIDGAVYTDVPDLSLQPTRLQKLILDKMKDISDTPPVESVVTPPVESVVTPPVESVVTPPVEPVVTPPVESVVTPPVESVVTPPVESVVTPPVETVASPSLTIAPIIPVRPMVNPTPNT